MNVSLTPLALAAAAMLAGCASSTNFSRAMEEPIRLVDKVSSVTREADDDVATLQAVGLIRDELPQGKEITVLVCNINRGPAAVTRTLSVFNDGLELVQDIGAAPSDISYAGYIRQFKKQREFLNTPALTPQELDTALAKRLVEQRQRCETLLQDDLDAATVVASKGANVKAAVAPFLGLLLAADQLAKTLLGAGEKLHREAAVKRALQDVGPQFEAAVGKLRRPPDAAFGPFVQFPDNASEIARSANQTSLGATLTLRRWTVARSLQQQWAALQPCRSVPTSNCLGDASRLALAQAFASNGRRYFALAQLVPDKTLEGIENSIAAARTAQKVDGVGGILDGLVGIASGLSDFNEAYQGFENAR